MMASGAGERWITAARVVAYPRLALLLYVAIAALWIGTSRDLIDREGKPIGADFITFYAAARLALTGEAAAAYDPEREFAAEQQAVPANQGHFPWQYPPTFLLPLLPLGLLPYLAALVVFIGGTLALYLWLIHSILPDRRAIVPALAFSAVLVNAIGGQNGFLSAALMGGGLLLLDRRPLLAGALLGLLGYKPQLALLLPFLLLAGGYWRSLAAAAASTLALAALSAAAFGIESWQRFLAHMPVARSYLESGALPWDKMVSVFAAARLMGAGLTFAYVLHSLVAATVALLTLLVWRRHGSLARRVALAVAASCLLSPFLYDYDLVVLAVPIALLVADGLASGWLPGLRTVLVVAWVAPMLGAPLARFAHLPLMPLVLLAIFAACYRRATRP